MSQKGEKRALRTKNTVAEIKKKKKKDKVKENFLEHKAKKA